MEYWCHSISSSKAERALIKCTLRWPQEHPQVSPFRWREAEQCGSHNTGWDAIHRDPNKFENWAHKNFIGFSKCKFRCCTSVGQSQIWVQTGGWTGQQQPGTEGLRGSSGWKALHGSAVCTTAQNTNHIIGCIQSEVASPSTLSLWNLEYSAWSTASRSEGLS